MGRQQEQEEELTFMAYILPVSAFLHPYTSPKPPRPIIRWTVGQLKLLPWENLQLRGKICSSVGKFAIPWEIMQLRGKLCNSVGKFAP